MKQSSLAAGLKAAAGHATPVPPASEPVGTPPKPKAGTSLIGGHYPKEVRRTLLLVQAEPENAGKTLKQLLGEAINDLCVKYGKPQPYSGED